MQSVIGTQFLNTTSLLLFLGFTAGVCAGVTYIGPLKSVYPSLQSCTLDFSIELLNLI